MPELFKPAQASRKAGAQEVMKPVVALDIDGTLSDYHGWFLKFAELYLGKPMPPANENTEGVPLYRWMRVSKQTYREVKLAYRQGGMKRSMPCYERASDLTRNIRRAGAEVWICTTRPYLRLDNIDPDTRHWLRRNGIQYDAVLFGEHKYRRLVKLVDPGRIVAVVDDLPELLKQAAALQLPCWLRDQPYNRAFREWDSARVYDMGEVEQVTIQAIGDWRITNG